MMDFIWAIGDVHGCFDQMMVLVNQVPSEEKIVFVGDYIDRGKKIAEVCAFVKKNINNDRYVFLRGNHEQMMIDAVGRISIDGWLINGGSATLKQLGSMGACEEIAAVFRDLPCRYETEMNYFVHGGMSPSLSFADQEDDVIMWLRPSSGDYNHGKFLIHGHTPIKEVDVRNFSANIDTGAVFGRKLSMVKIDNKTGKIVDIIQA